jgi:hypothetical protein
MPRPLSTPEKNPVPIVQEAGWAPGPVWKSAENLAASGIRSPDRPARSKSLYRLSYPAHILAIRSALKEILSRNMVSNSKIFNITLEWKVQEKNVLIILKSI